MSKTIGAGEHFNARDRSRYISPFSLVDVKGGRDVLASTALRAAVFQVSLNKVAF